MAVHLGIVTPGHLLVRSDNSGVVAVVNGGRSQSKNTNTVLKRVYLLQAQLGIRLEAVYVPTASNIADELS